MWYGDKILLGWKIYNALLYFNVLKLNSLLKKAIFKRIEILSEIRHSQTGYKCWVTLKLHC